MTEKSNEIKDTDLRSPMPSDEGKSALSVSAPHSDKLSDAERIQRGIAEIRAPTTPQFAALKPVYDRWVAAKEAREQAQAAEDALYREVYAIAVSIRENGIVDGNYALAPTFMKGRSIRKVDADLLRRMHPDIYDRANPHVDNNGIATILKSVHTEDELQQMTKMLNQTLWYEKSRVTVADLKKAVSEQEYRMLETEGIILTISGWNGDITLVNLNYRDAADAPRARFLPHADAEQEEDEE